MNHDTLRLLITGGRLQGMIILIAGRIGAVGEQIAILGDRRDLGLDGINLISETGIGNE